MKAIILRIQWYSKNFIIKIDLQSKNGMENIKIDKIVNSEKRLMTELIRNGTSQIIICNVKCKKNFKKNLCS